MGNLKFEERYPVHPEDFKKQYDTQRIRKEFLVENIFVKDEINLTLSSYDRYIVGGAYPVNDTLQLESIDPLKAEFFLKRREMGVINVGGKGIVEADGQKYELEKKEGIYLGQGTKNVSFKAVDKNNPPKFYINSAPAHHAYPTKKVALADANVLQMGSLETSNARKINQLLIHGVVETCQLQMGITELETGSVWNTMPAHNHSRRMEAYFYFDVPEGQAVCHFMGEHDETRHIWMKDCEAVLSPSWSIHSGAGTSNYCFIWGMAGENLDYGDMDKHAITDLK
jgi:4-deoxy-L-threo-5-hexosulose-uronate ketol-isomerase